MTVWHSAAVIILHSVKYLAYSAPGKIPALNLLSRTNTHHCKDVYFFHACWKTERPPPPVKNTQKNRQTKNAAAVRKIMQWLLRMHIRLTDFHTSRTCWVPKRYIIPTNDLTHRPSKKKKKNQSRHNPRICTMAGFEGKKNQDKLSTIYIWTRQSPNSDSWAMITIQIPMHSKSIRSPKVVLDPHPVSLLINTPGMHFEHGSQKHAKILDLTLLKSSKDEQEHSIIFRRMLITQPTLCYL